MAGQAGVRRHAGVTEAWPESFQDLASWCHQPQDELNTPQTLQDEFNFSVDGRGRDYPWEVSSPADLQSELWDSPDLALPSPSLGVDEDHNIEGHSLPGLTGGKGITSGKRFITPDSNCYDPIIKDSPIKINGNVLLSQSSVVANQSATSPDQQRNLLSLLKSEEPFITSEIGTATKLNSSTLHRQQFDRLKLPVAIKVEEADTGGGTCVIKQEEEECEGFKVPQMSQTEKRERPRLRLNIPAVAEPTTYALIDTPDVMRSLNDEAFDLLKFVDGEFDDPNVLSTDPSSIPAPVLEAEIDHRADLVTIKTDHDYTDARPKEVELTEVKSEPLSPVKEDLGGVVRRVGTKRRLTASSDEFNPDESDGSSEDDSLDWSPSQDKNKRGRGRGAARKLTGSKSRRTVKKPRKSSVESDGESVKSGTERYRELRDRNNEASRKSRLNRKQKEIEMIHLAEKLEKENVQLKNKSESLEKLVKKLREVLMNIVLKK